MRNAFRPVGSTPRGAGVWVRAAAVGGGVALGSACVPAAVPAWFPSSLGGSSPVFSPTLARAADDTRAGLTRYESKYHIIYTDISPQEAQEAQLRMTAMVDEYLLRTKDFSGKIDKKLPFYLFRNAEDYYAAGGMRGSAGVFNGQALMAIAGPRLSSQTWHVVQHEGFHQFASAVIGGQIPPWVNEGLAEYFGEAIYTGDGFQSGLIPNGRLARIKSEIRQKQFKPLAEMMQLSQRDWNAKLDIRNYDQGWAMVQFLAHGEGGRYQNAFGDFMVALGRRTPWQRAWQQTFGSAEGFEKKWAAYWEGLGDNPTIDLYARATTASLTSILARTTAMEKKTQTLADLADLLNADDFAFDQKDPLPQSFGRETFRLVSLLRRAGATVELAKTDFGNRPCVVTTLADQKRYVGTFLLARRGVERVTVEEQKPRVRPGAKGGPGGAGEPGGPGGTGKGKPGAGEGVAGAKT